MELAIGLILFVAGGAFGRWHEQRHWKSIFQREANLLHVQVTGLKYPAGLPWEAISHATLVTGSVVISVDFFKRFMAGIYNFFGGRIHSYESLLERARREAVLRMLESAPEARQIINLRIETSSISKGQGDQIGSVEVLAYGTALYAPHLDTPQR